MIHYDYEWDLYPNYMLLDKDLNVDRLGWKEGDLFRVETFNGQKMLKKLDPLTKFLEDGAKANGLT
jgi:hypothetical protein